MKNKPYSAVLGCLLYAVLFATILEGMISSQPQPALLNVTNTLKLLIVACIAVLLYIGNKKALIALLAIDFVHEIWVICYTYFIFDNTYISRSDFISADFAVVLTVLIRILSPLVCAYGGFAGVR